MNERNHKSQSTGGQNTKAENPIKTAAIEIFKKSQRLPALSRLLKKKKGQASLFTPPESVEFGDFYHL